MIVCEFCLQYRQDGKCMLGLNIPKGMSCREFGPGMERFCSDPKDFVSPNQIIQMAEFFGFKKGELKKVRLMAMQAEAARDSQTLAPGELAETR
jgi:hypothetical protein